MKFWKPKKQPIPDPGTEVVFREHMAFCEWLYGEVVQMLNETRATNAVKAKIASDYEAAMSLRRRLFDEGVEFTIQDIRAKLPENLWLDHEIKLTRSILEEGEGKEQLREEGRKALEAEAERLKERRKNL